MRAGSRTGASRSKRLNEVPYSFPSISAKALPAHSAIELYDFANVGQKVLQQWKNRSPGSGALESFLHLHLSTLAPLLIAVALWVAAIVLSISTLVPINNRIASLSTAAPAPGWERDHRKWDALHRVRILLLVLAVLLVVDALVA